jgi:hypothetical protein
MYKVALALFRVVHTQETRSNMEASQYLILPAALAN